MDWLDEQLDRLQLRSVRLKSTLFLTLVVGLILVAILWILTISVTVSWQRLAIGDQVQLNTWEYLTWRPPADLSHENTTLYLLEIIRWSSLAWYLVLYCGIASRLFIKSQITQPLIIISDGVEQMKSGDLSQPLYYKGNDEFQLLTEQFNEMRLRLKESQEKVQQLHTEQKKINAAFSHDLRTPLTVIQNNAEMIETFYPNGKMTEELLEKSLRKIQSNVQRLSEFSDTMKTIQKIDDFTIQLAQKPLSILIESVRELLSTFDLKEASLHLNGNFETVAVYDLHIIMEVLENLLTNAIRYRKKKTDVTLELQNDYLFLFVKDDGCGFTKEELTHATTPYFSKNKGEHFGLGLTIASSLTEKHGGILKLANGVENGAIVSAIFHLSRN